MKYLSIFLIATITLLCNCTNENSKQVKEEVQSNQPVGLYKAEIGFDQLISKAELDTADSMTKMFMSMASLLEVRVNFQDNGFLKIEGDFGFFQFPKLDNVDSIKYKIVDSELILEDNELKIENDGEKIPMYLEKNTNGFVLTADSMEIQLVKL